MDATLVRYLRGLTPETTVVFFWMGVDGFTVNLEDWQKMDREYNLRIFLFFFGVTEVQWNKKKPPWTASQWSAPAFGRRWTLMNVKSLFENVEQVMEWKAAQGEGQGSYENSEPTVAQVEIVVGLNKLWK